MDKQHHLVDEEGIPIAVGATVTDFRGETWTLTGWDAPRHPGSTGRVYVRQAGTEREFFPSVIKAQIVPVKEPR